MMPGDLMNDDVRDVVVRAPMSFDEARRLTDEANRTLEDFQRRAITLHDGRAHEALGYKNWPLYAQAEFKLLPRMARLAKREYIRELAAEGWSQRDVAATVGVDQATVSRALTDANASPEPPAGADQPDPTTAPAGPSEPPAAAFKGPAAAGPEDRPIVWVRQQYGDPKRAEVWEDDPGRSTVKVVYLDSRTGAWIARDRIVDLPEERRLRGIAEDLHDNVHPQPGDPAPATPDGVEGFVPDRPRDDWAPAAQPGVVESAVPAGPTAEAPADPDRDAEYRAWRAHALKQVARARSAYAQLSGDGLDVTTVVERADDKLLRELERLSDDLTKFLKQVRDLRPKPAELEDVWVAAQRHGSTFHRPHGATVTHCGRSTRTGVFLPRRSAEVGGLDGKPCPRCWPNPARYPCARCGELLELPGPTHHECKPKVLHQGGEA